ncbi:TraC (plasmid) [Klebsiella pneumoniae]|nr:TraC [Klebsiella pneumoniae]
MNVIVSKEVMSAVWKGVFQAASNSHHVAGINRHDHRLIDGFADTGCCRISLGIKQVVTILQLATHNEKTPPCLAVFFKVFTTVGPDALKGPELAISIKQGDHNVAPLISFKAVSGNDLFVFQVCQISRGIRKPVIFFHQPVSGLIKLIRLRCSSLFTPCRSISTEHGHLFRVRGCAGRYPFLNFTTVLIVPVPPCRPAIQESGIHPLS